MQDSSLRLLPRESSHVWGIIEKIGIFGARSPYKSGYPREGRGMERVTLLVTAAKARVQASTRPRNLQARHVDRGNSDPASGECASNRGLTHPVSVDSAQPVCLLIAASRNDTMVNMATGTKRNGNSATQVRHIVDDKGDKTAVVLPIELYEKLLDEIEELQDIKDFDRAMAKGEWKDFEEVARRLGL